MNDLLFELIVIVLQVYLLGSLGVLTFGALLLTCLATMYNWFISLSTLVKIYRRIATAQASTNSGGAQRKAPARAPKKVKKEKSTDANPEIISMF